MRKVLLLVLVLISGYSYGQVYQQMSQYGVEFKRMDNDSVLRIPRGLGSLRSISGYDTAQIRYNVSDSSVYVHTGNNWIKAIRATGADADSSVFATVHKLYTTIDSLGNLIVSENLGNSNLTQSDPTRTYDGDGGELSFSNLGKFKVSASDSVVLKVADNELRLFDYGLEIGSPSVLVTGSQSASIEGDNNLVTGDISVNLGGADNIVSGTGAVNLGGSSNSPRASNSITLGGNNLVSNEETMVSIGANNDTTITNTALVVGNGTVSPSNALQLLKTGELYLPYYTNTDTNKVLSANASGLLEWRTKGAGGSVAFVSDTLRAASTSGVNIKNSLGNTAAIFGASNTTTTELLGRVKINKDSVDIVSDKKWALVIDTANNEIDRRDLDSLYNDESIDLFSFYGSTIRSSTIPLWAYNSSQAITENRVYFQPQRIKKGTYSGFKFGVSTPGNYVGDAANQIGIYSYSGGTLTLIDSTTRDTELWKGAANSISTKALNSPLVIPRDGNYVIGFLYNYSSITTSPRIVSLVPTILSYTNLYSNSAGFKYINYQNVLPSSVAMSSMSWETGSIMLIGLY